MSHCKNTLQFLHIILLINDNLGSYLLGNLHRDWNWRPAAFEQEQSWINLNNTKRALYRTVFFPRLFSRFYHICWYCQLCMTFRFFSTAQSLSAKPLLFNVCWGNCCYSSFRTRCITIVFWTDGSKVQSLGNVNQEWNFHCISSLR